MVGYTFELACTPDCAYLCIPSPHLLALAGLDFAWSSARNRHIDVFTTDQTKSVQVRVQLEDRLSRNDMAQLFGQINNDDIIVLEHVERSTFKASKLQEPKTRSKTRD